MGKSVTCVFFLLDKTRQPLLKLGQRVFLLSNQNCPAVENSGNSILLYIKRRTTKRQKRSYNSQSALWLPSVSIHPRRVTAGWRTQSNSSSVPFYVVEKQVITVAVKI